MAKRLMAPVLCASLTVIACGSLSRSQKEVAPPVSAPLRTIATSSPPAPAPASPPLPELPRTLSLGAFPEGERIADLAAVAVDDRILLAWVTYFDDGAASARRGRSAGRARAKAPASAEPPNKGASVMVRLLDKNGDPFAQPYVISTKAVSIGGVAVAPSSGTRHDVGLAWVGKDNGVGQVFVTRVSPAGEKTQRMITRSKVGCSDVALTAAGPGWIAAWVETHEDKAEIFAAQIGRDLGKVGVERRIAESRGEASNLRVIARGDEVLAAWSEVRSEGEGGIFVARLLAADLSVRGDPVVVAPTLRHALGLEAALLGEGAAIGWVEEGPVGSSARAAFLASVDSAPRGPSERISAVVAADPSSIALDCDRVCHVVVPGAERGELVLYGFSYDSSRKPEVPVRLAAVAGVSTEDVSPVLVKDWLFFAEDNLRGRGRIRKAKLAW